jgi:uncharacterized membrane protein HdeD (DUF308 family)
MNKKAKGKGFLKVTGILLIIFGAFSLISGVISVVTASKAASDGGQLLDSMNAIAQAQGINYTYTAQGLMTAAILALVVGALYLAAGIIGVANCNKPQKAQMCFIMGIIMIVAVLADAVYQAMNGTFGIIGTVLNLILPVLYLIGANKNKQMLDMIEMNTADSGENVQE